MRRTPMPAVDASTDASVSGGHSTSLAIIVPAHGRSITATVVAYPTVTTSLLDPHGKDKAEVAAGTAAAYGLFRTLTVRAPVRGVWHLESSVTSGGAAATVLASVSLGTQPASVALSVKSLAVKHPRHGAATQLQLTARARHGGRAVRGAHATVSLLISTQRQVLLRLAAVRHRLGSYAATTAPLKTATPATLVVRTSVGSAATVSTYELERSCG